MICLSGWAAEPLGTHVQIVTNREAGGYRPQVIKALVSALAAEGATATITYTGPNQQLLIEQDADLLCAAGGDGTLRHVVKAVADGGRAVPVAPYPMGTINLYHREVGYPKDAANFARRALGGTHAALHFPVELNDTLFLGCASIGPDAHAVANVSSGLKQIIGRSAYVVALARLLFRWPRPKLTLITDGKRHACEAVYIAKGTYFAGPWSFAPNATRVNQKLHVITLKEASRRKFLHFIHNTMRGRPLEARDNLIVLSCTALRIEGDADWPVQADGDDAARLPVEIAARGNAVRVL